MYFKFLVSSNFLKTTSVSTLGTFPMFIMIWASFVGPLLFMLHLSGQGSMSPVTKGR